MLTRSRRLSGTALARRLLVLVEWLRNEAARDERLEGIMVRPAYSIEFYEDEDGSIPVLRWLREELTPEKRRALGTAMNEILQHLGPSVVEGNFGDTLGGGLFEFRLDQDVEQILARKGKRAKPRDRGDASKILLRVFCHAHGKKIILLVGGYDKAQHSSPRYQQSQIAVARARLKSWQERHKKLKKV